MWGHSYSFREYSERARVWAGVRRGSRHPLTPSNIFSCHCVGRLVALPTLGLATEDRTSAQLDIMEAGAEYGLGPEPQPAAMARLFQSAFPQVHWMKWAV